MRSILPKSYDDIQTSLLMMTERSKFVGGGTDFVIKMRMGLENPDILCYLGYVKELKEIHEEDDFLSIGAYATMTEIEKNASVCEHYPALAHAAGDVGSLQIRNNGTIGGNIGNASPAGDLLPVLYLYDAMVEVMGPKEIRRLHINDVLAGPGKMTLSHNEVIIRILLPTCRMNTCFVKLGSRRKVTISRIGIALGIQMEADHVKDICLYIGAVSVKPLHLTKAEDLIRGKVVNEPNILDMAKILSDYIKENVPLELDRDYKVYAARGAMLDAFVKLGLA